MHGVHSVEPTGSIVGLELVGRDELASTGDEQLMDDHGCNAVLLLQQFGEVCFYWAQLPSYG